MRDDQSRVRRRASCAGLVAARPGRRDGGRDAVGAAAAADLPPRRRRRCRRPARSSTGPATSRCTPRTGSSSAPGSARRRPRGTRRMAVLVAPGNGGNRAGRAGLAEELSRRGLAVLLMDYRGYGGNPGSPSEEGLAADAVAAIEALAELGYPPERTIYFGESLGSGVVAALQARRPPAGWCCDRRSPSSPTSAPTTTRGCPCGCCCATGSRSSSISPSSDVPRDGRLRRPATRSCRPRSASGWPMRPRRWSNAS